MTGYVYFLRAKGYSSGWKIGYSTKPIARLKTLKSELGIPLILSAAIRGTRDHEKAMHAILCHKRCHGEWFYTRGDTRCSKFLFEIMHKRKAFPPDFIRRAKHYHEIIGGTIGLCICGRRARKP